MHRQGVVTLKTLIESDQLPGIDRKSLDRLPPVQVVRHKRTQPYVLPGQPVTIAIPDWLHRVDDGETLSVVVAHELGHVSSGDVERYRRTEALTLSLVAFSGMMIAADAWSYLQRSAWSDENHAVRMSLVGTVGLGLMVLVATQRIASRQREYESDGHAREILADGEAVRAVLGRLSRLQGLDTRAPKARRTWHSLRGLLNFHPTLEARVAALGGSPWFPDSVCFALGACAALIPFAGFMAASLWVRIALSINATVGADTGDAAQTGHAAAALIGLAIVSIRMLLRLGRVASGITTFTAEAGVRGTRTLLARCARLAARLAAGFGLTLYALLEMIGLPQGESILLSPYLPRDIATLTLTVFLVAFIYMAVRDSLEQGETALRLPTRLALARGSAYAMFGLVGGCFISKSNAALVPTLLCSLLLFLLPVAWNSAKVFREGRQLRALD